MCTNVYTEHDTAILGSWASEDFSTCTALGINPLQISRVGRIVALRGSRESHQAFLRPGEKAKEGKTRVS